MKTAILIGATGLTGGIVLEKLLLDSAYSKVKIFGRRSVGVKHPKLEEYIADLFHMEKISHNFHGDEIFCCVGTTKAKTPDLELYRKVDYGIPVKAANLARQNSIDTLLIVSAMGADPESKFFYNRIKGEMERDVLEEKVPNTHFFQPSLIGGHRNERRFFEYLWKQVMKVGNHLLIGSLHKYRSIDAEIIATAMIDVARNGYHKFRIESHEIKVIAEKAEVSS